MELTKTIRTNVTLHVADTGYLPNDISREGFVSGGSYKFKAIKPGTPVTLPAAEADEIIERHGGEELESASADISEAVAGEDPAKEPEPKVVEGKKGGKAA